MVVLDTHAWLFWVNDDTDKLSQRAFEAISGANGLGISVISCWEIAMLVEKKRLMFSIDVNDWINKALSYPKIRLIDLSPEIAVLSTRLPGNFHADPADRIIVASCMKNNAALITRDRHIHSWKYIRSIW